MLSIDLVQKEMDWKTVKFSSCGVFLDFSKAFDTVSMTFYLQNVTSVVIYFLFFIFE